MTRAADPRRPARQTPSRESTGFAAGPRCEAAAVLNPRRLARARLQAEHAARADGGAAALGRAAQPVPDVAGPPESSAASPGHLARRGGGSVTRGKKQRRARGSKNREKLQAR